MDHRHGPAPPADRGEFNQYVYALVRLIPPRRVMTYGQIARLIPEPTFLDGIAYRRIRARWVGYALAACPGDIPWQRVINQRGKPSTRETGGHLAQEALLAAEGTPRRPDGSIDLEAAGWSPANVDWASILPEGDEPREATKGRLP